MEKVVLVLVDGMRPDGMLQCEHPYVKALTEKSAYTFDARTVMPSVTLPCHMSLVHSVDPDRHNTLTNTYVPQVRPIVGLFDQLAKHEKKCGFFNQWEPLRVLYSHGYMHTYVCYNLTMQTNTDVSITETAVDYIKREQPDFTFIYLGETDEVGHAHGWMGKAYLAAIHNAWDCIEKIHAALPEGYTLMVTADHGGHDRMHGTEMPEDMTIPLYCCGEKFPAGEVLNQVSIKDIAPTIAALMGVPCVKEWEGKVLFA